MARVCGGREHLVEEREVPELLIHEGVLRRGFILATQMPHPDLSGDAENTEESVCSIPFASVFTRDPALERG